MKRVALGRGVRGKFEGFVDIDELRPKPMAVLPISRDGVQAAVASGKSAPLVVANLSLNSIAKVEQYLNNVIHGEPSSE
jgi:hypothetical protein